MELTYTRQYNGKERIEYDVLGEALTITALGVSEVLDLSSFPEGGVFEGVEFDRLTVQPLVDVKREGGLLKLTLLEWYGD